MPKKYDVVATMGKYQKAGQEKTKYQTVGMVIEKDGKFYLKMSCPVVVNDDGQVINFFGLYEPRSSQETAQQGVQQAQAAINQPAGDFDDDIPF